MWLKAAEMNTSLWFSRVGTHDNIADDPSREDYRLLRALHAEYVKPVLDDAFWASDSWDSLKCTRVFYGESSAKT